VASLSRWLLWFEKDPGSTLLRSKMIL